MARTSVSKVYTFFFVCLFPVAVSYIINILFSMASGNPFKIGSAVFNVNPNNETIIILFGGEQKKVRNIVTFEI